MTDVNDSRKFRNALGRFATGVTVITARAQDGSPIGLTANSFSSVSLDPAMVLWSLGRQSPRVEDYVACDGYAIHILSKDQEALSNRFATPSDNKFDNLDWYEGEMGIPMLRDVETWFVCKNQTRHDGGDHIIFVGEVTTFNDAMIEDPLLFFGGRYAALNGPSE